MQERYCNKVYSVEIYNTFNWSLEYDAIIC